MAKSVPSIKIGFVLDGGLQKPDGVQQYILALGQYYKRQGHEVRYIVAGKITPGIENAVSLSRSLKVISNGNRLTVPLPASRKTIKDYLSREQFDVLHIQTPYSPMMGEQLIFQSNPKTAIIGTFHIVPKTWYLSVGDWLLGHYCYFSIKRFDQMLSTSTASQYIAKRDFRINSEVLPNVIDYKKFNQAKAFSMYQDGTLNILFFGRLVPRKGCLYLLQAISHLINNGNKLPKFRVIVCGAGPMESTLKKYALKNNLDKIVEFKGFIEEKDKPKFYASADIAVFPSTGGESFGIVLLEAMASGKAAVLAGNNEGYKTVMAPQANLLFKPQDSAGLASKIENLLRNELQRQKYSQWGENYSKEFDVNIVGAKLFNIYQNALHNRSS